MFGTARSALQALEPGNTQAALVQVDTVSGKLAANVHFSAQRATTGMYAGRDLRGLTMLLIDRRAMAG